MCSQQEKNAKKYAFLKYALSIVEVFYLSFLLFLFLKAGLSKSLTLWLLKFQGIKPLILPFYLLSVSLAYYVLSFPLNFYHSFSLEHKFSLSTQNLSGWLKDQLKAFLLSYIIMLIAFLAFYSILSRFIHAWWLAASFFWIFFNIILIKLTPVLIIPMFFKYKKLLDESLRSRILKLAKKMQVGVLDCFEIDFSSKTVKGNAALTGLGKSRRVILADTLKDKYSVDEIEIILAHEFAHHRLKHIWKLMALNSLAAFLYFYLIFVSSEPVLRFFGLHSLWDIAGLPVVLLYFLILNLVMQPLANYISRRLEMSADKMALYVTGSKEAFISMMNKLATQNLADRNPHPLFKFFFFDHPPIDERIARALSYNLKE